MGADLILAYTSVPHDKDGELFDFVANDPGWERLQAIAHSRVEALPSSALDLVLESFGRLDIIADEVDTQLEPGDTAYDEAVRAAGLAYVRGCVDVVLDAYRHGYRDTTMFRIDGKWYMFSGGMSWGDDPCESWESVGVVGGAAIFNEPVEL